MINYTYIALLVKKIQCGDSNAFAELYSLTYENQYRYACHYLKDKDLAQDALQEIYILVLKKIDTIKEPKAFMSWLKQISFRVCYDMNKKNHTIINHESGANEKLMFIPDEQIDHNPEANVMSITNKNRIKATIEKLPNLEKQALLLKFVEGKKQKEIALSMGCSLSSVKRYLINGKKRLYAMQIQEDSNETTF